VQQGGQHDNAKDKMTKTTTNCTGGDYGMTPKTTDNNNETTINYMIDYGQRRGWAWRGLWELEQV
jgi:hypothetical protein